MRQKHPLLEDYLSEIETGKALNRTPRTLAIWRQRGEGPTYVKIGRTVYYNKDTILAWLKANEIKPIRAG